MKYVMHVLKVWYIYRHSNQTATVHKWSDIGNVGKSQIYRIYICIYKYNITTKNYDIIYIYIKIKYNVIYLKYIFITMK
jgi:hypothetical protein